MSRDEDVFAEACELPVGERSAFLVRACVNDPALHLRVEALLAGYAETERAMPGAFFATRENPLEEKPGDRIGRYKLLEKIGEGGCGAVWMAEQEESVRRRVALKVIKLGMDTKEVIARFEAERQALAMMDHANIARIFDAGTTDTGRPFFVMELVRGIPITRFCDDAGLPTEKRLRLFIQVCHAIQHAHQKGIIHRDIKPSNILVTLHDDVPVPKVIDFGIAKATGAQLTDKTLFTHFHTFIGTPTYTSPEQMQMSGLDVDTRSDIYSLGVLLYELMTGRPPFDADALIKSGLEAMRRTIREVDPPRPSTRLGTLSEKDRASVAHQRSTDAAKLSVLLRGDLDWIAMRCLEKDRKRRYETANGLARDIQRHLDDEAVLARPPGAAYRFQKAAKRNKLAFTAAGAVALVLLAGLSFSTWSFLRERKAHAREAVQRKTAIEEQGKAEAARASEAEQRTKAEAEKITANRHLYAANMNLAQQAWEQTDITRLRQLLDETQGNSFRGFEWYYWQRQTHLAVETLDGDGGAVHAVAVSPDSRRIVTGCFRKTADVWDAATGKKLFALHGHTASVNSVAFSPDGQRIVTGSTDQTLKVWNATGGPEILTLTGHRGPIFSVTFSPDGQRIVSGSEDTTAMIWDAAGGPALHTLKGHGARIWSVAFSPNGERIVTGGGTPTGQGVQPGTGKELSTMMTKVWEARSGRELFTLRGHGRSHRAAVSPNGQWIVTGSGDGTAKLWEAGSGKEVLTFKGHESQIWSVAFSPDSQRIATGSHDRMIKVWDVSSGQELHTLKGHSGMIFSVSFSPDGQRIVTGSVDGTAKVWDAFTSDGLITLKGHRAPVGSAAFSPDGQRIVTSSNDWTAKVWEAASGQENIILKGHGARVSSASFSPDDQWVVTCSYDNTAKVWEANSGREKLTLVGHSAPILAARFSPDGRWIVTGSSDKTAKVWEAVSGREMFTINGHTAPIGAVAYSPDGRSIVTGGDDMTAKIWNAVTGHILITLNGHTSTISAVAFSPDGRSIVTGSSDATAKVWEAASGRERMTISGHTINSHAAPITSVAYSPNGERIVTGSDDKTAGVWEATTGQRVLTLVGHRGRVNSVAFSPNGQHIVTSSDDRNAIVWHAATPEQVTVWNEKENAMKQHRSLLGQSRAADEERQRIARATDVGAIKQWLILAPIPLPANLTYWEGFNYGLDTEQIKDERLLQPVAGERAALASGDLTWRSLAQKDNVIDFIAFAGRMNERSVAYAVCYIRSETEQSGLRILVGSDGRAKVYLNEKQVHEYRFGRGFESDQDTVKDITLKAGLNVLVLKVVIEPAARAWRDSIRFTDAQGHPVKGIRVTLDP